MFIILIFITSHICKFITYFSKINDKTIWALLKRQLTIILLYFLQLLNNFLIKTFKIVKNKFKKKTIKNSESIMLYYY